MSITCIFSGGQSGADMAAIDAALETGTPYSGWVPKGFINENGVIPSHYSNLLETNSEKYEIRTEWNARYTDATLIFSHGALVGGSKYTKKMAVRHHKPYKHIDLNLLSDEDAAAEIKIWLYMIKPQKLNIAGPRASKDAKIYERTKKIMIDILHDNKEKIPDPAKEELTLDQKLTIALALRDSALANFRHWDQIRWQVPAWFCALSSIFILTLDKNPDEYSYQIANIIIIVFGMLCLMLLEKLALYHNKQIDQFNIHRLKEIGLDEDLQKLVKIELDFEMKKGKFLKTATYWYAMTIALIVILLSVNLLMPLIKM